MILLYCWVSVMPFYDNCHPKSTFLLYLFQCTVVLDNVCRWMSIVQIYIEISYQVLGWGNNYSQKIMSSSIRLPGFLYQIQNDIFKKNLGTVAEIVLLLEMFWAPSKIWDLDSSDTWPCLELEKNLQLQMDISLNIQHFYTLLNWSVTKP